MDGYVRVQVLQNRSGDKIWLYVYLFRNDIDLEGRLEYLSRAIMSAKSCNVRPSSISDGEFLHELEEKLEV